MPDLKIDLGDLQNAVRRLGTVERNFGSAERVGGDIASLTGHSGLANKVNEFASNWSIHRDDILSSVGAVKETMNTIHTEFIGLERELKSTIASP